MIKKVVLGGLAALALAGASAKASAECKLSKFADLPVTLIHRRPVISAIIKGREAPFTVDSGAFYSLITHANAEKYGLTLGPVPFGFLLQGATGSADTELGTAKDFTIAGALLHRVEFLVGGSEVGAQTVGLLGQNVLHIHDIEYDLANGAIRMFLPRGCGDAKLAYWVGRNDSYSVMPIEPTTPQAPHTRGDVVLNGVRLRALFDTGAEMSVVSLRAAGRAGVKPSSPGVVPAERSSGIGQRTVQSWIAPIASFKIGDEEIKNTKLIISDLDLGDTADMLLGADFFLSHRVYVATSQRKLYFTYNGGPVFDLGIAATAQAATSRVPSAPAARGYPSPAAAASALSATPLPDEPIDAAGYARRGAAYVGRGQLDKALADLTRAVDLAPAEPSYLYERAEARLAHRQPLLAMADLDQALKLKPDYVSALVSRSILRLEEADKSRSVADLETADTLAARQDDIRLEMGQIYMSAGRLPAAIAEFDRWIDAHGADYRLGEARNSRCWARALLGQDLDKALADCNGAIRMMPRTAAILDSRGLVFLRRGELDRAIKDYDAALALDPKIAWSLYGRGLAELKKGMTAQGEADIAAATQIDPRIAETAKANGVSPSAEPLSSPGPAGRPDRPQSRIDDARAGRRADQLHPV